MTNFFHPLSTDNDTSLGTERQRLDAQKWAGTNCCACKRLVKVYERKFRATWARFLEAFHNKYGLKPQRINRDNRHQLPDANDWRFLADFGLMRRPLNAKTGKPGRSVWQVTEAGKEFLSGEITIPAMIQVLDDEVIKSSLERINFQQAMQMTGEFNKDELLRRATPIIDSDPLSIATQQIAT